MKKIEVVNRPIMYISLSIILASIAYGLYHNNKGLVIVVTSLFFIYFIKEFNYVFTIVLIIFFILQLGVNYFYYNSINEGEVYDQVRIVDNKGYYTIGKYKGRIICINNLGDDLISGDKILVKGKFKEDIDYERGIVGNIEVNSYSKEDTDIIAIVNKIPSLVFNKLKENVGQRKAALILSVSLGYKNYIDSEDKEEMNNLGIIHVMSVSGLHVALVFAGCRKLFKDKMSLGIVTFYVLLTGAEFSSLRSLFMICIVVMARKCQRNYYSIIALLISAVINLVIQPFAIFSIGFLLSYLATLGIIIFNNKIKDFMRFLPEKIASVFAISLSAQVLTVPILIYYFGKISITFLLGNLLVVPLLNLVIILGNLLILSFYVDGLFDFISYIVLRIINIVDKIMNKLYSISEGGLIINKKMVMVYLLTLVSIYFIYKGYKRFILLPVISVVITFIIIYSPLPKIDYIEKGVILISYKGDRNIISTKNTVKMKELKELYLANEGYRLINRVVIDKKIEIVSNNNNFLLRINNEEYYIKLNNYGEIGKEYDIINFIDEEVKGFYIIGEDILTY